MISINSSTQSRQAGTLQQAYVDLQDARTSSALLVEEYPLAISYGDLSHAVMMVTPNDLEAFVIGFSLTEGIIDNIDQIQDLELEPVNPQCPEQGINARVTLSSRRQTAFRQQRRQRQGATGCGLCGIESLQAALPELPALKPAPLPPPGRLTQLRDELFRQQQLGRQAGAIHAAMLVSPQGDLLACCEDIGRHNALDKLLGRALQQGIDLYGHAAVMSSRCSTELIQKAIRAGLSSLIHLASPSTLAVNLARSHGLNLVHLPRHNGPRLYAGTAWAAHQEITAHV